MFSKQTGITWKIKTRSALSQEDWSFIRKLDPVIYWNDIDCYYWAFDTKLPSGRWLENMKIDCNSSTINALVL